jgi:hypothetical protein
MVTHAQNNIYELKRIFDLYMSTASSTSVLIEPAFFSLAQKHYSDEKLCLMNITPYLKIQHGLSFLLTQHKNSTWSLDGTVARYKARLIAKGFHQLLGIKFTKTCSPVIKPATIHLVLSIAVSHGWSLRQVDVSSALLQGTPTENIFIQQPQGFVHSQFPNYVYELNKEIYGLRQAPHAWYTELCNFLLDNGFFNLKCDTSLFIQQTSTIIIYLLVYVDDIIIIIIITGSNDHANRVFIKKLANRLFLNGPWYSSLFY